MESLDFPEAMKRAAELAGVSPDAPPPSRQEQESATRKRKLLDTAMELADDAEKKRAELGAVGYWERLATESAEGFDYLRRRGVEAMAREVRFTEHQVCVPLRQLDGGITNVMRRRFADGDGPRLLSLKGCSTSGTYGDPRKLEETEGPVIIVEGFFDWLSARVLAPGRLVLGAHSAGRLSDVVRLVAEHCGSRGLVFVPHKDTSEVGERQAKKAIQAAREQGVPADKIRKFDVGKGCNDLNDYLLVRGSTEGNPLDTAPSLAELDERHCFAFNDVGNAARFAHVHRQHFRFATNLRQWKRWRGHCWDTSDETVHLVQGAIGVTDQIEREGVMTEPRDPELAAKLRAHAHRSQSEARINAMIKLARARPELVVSIDDLNKDPFLLSCDNGTIDLRTGVLREHRREDLITVCSPIAYDPDAKCPRWERFLAEVFEPNPDAIEFVRRFMGYSLTGDTSAQCLLFAYGNGANGKGVLFRCLEKVLGADLAVPAPFDAFVQKRHGDAPFYALADLFGKRVVFVSEGNQNDRLAEGLVKQVTGGDLISARFPHGRFFKYRPTFKLWMSSNYLPRIRGNDHGMWRRFRLVPFEVSFTDRRDDHLEEKLDQELPGIFAWAVRGCLDWQLDGGGLEGLGDSVSIAEATAEYRSESDHVGQFLELCCVTNVEGVRMRTTAVYAAYRLWAEAEGLRPLSNSQLGRELKRRGFNSEKGNRARFYPIGLVAEQADD